MCRIQGREEFDVSYISKMPPKHANKERVWAQIAKSLNNIQSLFAGNKAIEDGLQKFILELVTPATETIGWDSTPKEDNLTIRLRSLLIATAGGAGHES